VVSVSPFGSDGSGSGLVRGPSDRSAEIAGLQLAVPPLAPPGESAAVFLQPVAVSMPRELDHPWLADEVTGHRDTQQHLFDAKGQQAARKPAVTAAASKVPAQTAVDRLAAAGAVAAAKQQTAEATRAALTPFVTRPVDGTKVYWLRKGLLLVGDITGITAMSILLGEVTSLALLLAIAVGVAAIIGGLAGGEVKKAKLAAQRAIPADRLPEQLQPWRHLFVAGGAR